MVGGASRIPQHHQSCQGCFLRFQQAAGRCAGVPLSSAFQQAAGHQAGDLPVLSVGVLEAAFRALSKTSTLGTAAVGLALRTGWMDVAKQIEVVPRNTSQS